MRATRVISTKTVKTNGEWLVKLVNVCFCFQTKLVFLNGWKLGIGPCFNCSGNDIGVDVTERKQHNYQSRSEFGRWILEFPLVHYIPPNSPIVLGNITYKGHLNDDIDITSYVYENTRDEVLMISQHDGWEMERSETVMDIPFAGKEAYFDLK